MLCRLRAFSAILGKQTRCIGHLLDDRRTNLSIPDKQDRRPFGVALSVKVWPLWLAFFRQ